MGNGQGLTRALLANAALLAVAVASASAQGSSPNQPQAIPAPPALNLLPCPRLGPASTIQPLRIQPRQVAAKNRMGCLSAEDAVYGPDGCPIRFCGTQTPRLALPGAPGTRSPGAQPPAP
jgi:hypothetical protein